MKRKYLALFLLPKPQREHEELISAIRDVSEGDFKPAFTTANKAEGGVVAYLLTSSIPPWEMGFRLLNGDRTLIVEVGELFTAPGLNVAGAWLRSRQAPR